MVVCVWGGGALLLLHSSMSERCEDNLLIVAIETADVLICETVFSKHNFVHDEITQPVIACVDIIKEVFSAGMHATIARTWACSVGM